VTVRFKHFSPEKICMDTRRILCYIGILRAIQGDPITVSDIAATCSPSRSTIHHFLQECEDWSLVNNSEDGYGLTAAGSLILREYGDLDEQKQAGLPSLAKSEKRLNLLRITTSHPDDRAELTRRADASKSTVRRHMKDFQDEGWTDEQNKCIELTPDGRKILDTYDTFEQKIGIIEDKTEFLERYGTNNIVTRIPLEALAESRQVVSTTTDRQKVVREVNDIDPGDAEGEPLRALAHAFSAQISDESYSNLSPETDSELIVDRSVYAAITNPKRWKYLFEGLRYPNFQLLVLPKEITVALAYCGNEEAVIATYSEEKPLHVGLFGDSEALIEWVQQTYDHYRAQADPPGTDLFKWATGATEIPFAP
jgi:predicted transcriptional regulator